MLDNKGFDLWADEYDESTCASDENSTYPFAGYKKILNTIYKRVLSMQAKNVLDIGFGTAVLTAKLYENGCNIWGQDFSDKMIKTAREKMPEAKLYQKDFTEGLEESLHLHKYDAIIATYSLHHLTDEEKAGLLKHMLGLLTPGGRVYIGDVAFQTRADLEKCREQNIDEWDDEEIYFVYDEIAKNFENISFEQVSDCAGIIELWK